MNGDKVKAGLAPRDPEALDPMGAQNHPLPGSVCGCGRFKRCPDHPGPCRGPRSRVLTDGPVVRRALVEITDLEPDLDFIPEPVVMVGGQAPRVIGLCGVAGSGKSTAAEVLVGQGYERISIADPIRWMIGALLEGQGLVPAAVAEALGGGLKELADPALGWKSPRHAMQTLGTEWGRVQMGADFWVQIARRRIRDALAKGGRVVVDDVRMLNEADLVKGIGTDARGEVYSGSLWLVTGRGGIAGDHESEAHSANLRPDRFLDNGRDLAHLVEQVLDGVAS